MASCRLAVASRRALLPPPPPLLAARRFQAPPSPALTARHVAAAAEHGSGTTAAAVPSSSTETAVAGSPAQQHAPSAHRAPFSPPHFADFPLDRAAGLRRQEQELQRLLTEPSTRVLLLHRGKLLVAPASAAPPADDTDSSITGSGSFGMPDLALQPHSFAPPGAEAPDGGPPQWLPLTADPAQLQPVLAAATEGQAPSSRESSPDFLFLGLEPNGQAVFALQSPDCLLPLLPPTDGGSGTPGAAEQPCWVDGRSGGQRMTPADAAVAALACGLVLWHASAAFCSRTGAPTRASSGGHSRTPPLPAAGGRRPHSVYPRIDPAVIVAVGCGDWLLLGRKATWDQGRYSCLAGFMEVGETLEQTVGREVLEESGVAVDLGTVRYHSSQPWPFPSSLMVGFTAEATTAGTAAGPHGIGASNGDGPQAQQAQQLRGLQLLQGQAMAAAREVGLKPEEAERYLLPQLPPVQVDPAELEDARWFHADWLAAATGIGTDTPHPSVVRSGSGASDSSQDFRIPGRYALANRIIESWLEAQRAQRARHDAAAEALDAVPDVVIDEGVFKYVLLRLSTADGLHSKLLVRGDVRAAYHNHCYQATAAEVRGAAPDAGLRLETVGGGRIENYSDQRVTAVYGYSAAFGQAPHDVTAALLHRWLPLHTVSVSYEGY